MAKRRTIGQILIGFGRITEADAEKALHYQQQNGGYFGGALLELGLVTQEELEWSLASQFDLPYVFPDANSIDPEAAGLVTPEWALANLTLPIMEYLMSGQVDATEAYMKASNKATFLPHLKGEPPQEFV